MADPRVRIIVDAQDKASSVFKSIASGLGDIAKGAASFVIGGAINAIPGLIMDISNATIDLVKNASSMQSIEAAFAGIAEAAGTSADAMLSALAEQSLGMISNRDLMTSFNQAAQLVGQDFATRLPDAFSYLGKIAAATGQDMGFMLDSLVKGVGRLSPMILDNLGIQVNLTEANEAYAESIGVSADELTKEQQQIAMMNMVMEKLAENTAAMPEVAGTAQQAFASFDATMANLKDQIGTALLPAITPLLGAFSNLAQKYLPMVASAFTSTIVPAISSVAEWFMARLPAAIEFLTNAWTNVLQPAIAAVWTWLSTVLIPFFNDTIAPMLAEAIPAALQFLATVWTNVLQPAISTVWAWISGVLIPFFQDKVVPILQVVIPAALAFLADVWQNVLLPIITGIWEFLTVDMMPVWEAIGDLLGVVIPLVLTALAAIWENVLKPALLGVWEFISTYILPIFTSLADAIGWVSDAISDVIGWVGDFIDALKNIDLPDWLTPGSPTPFELGLRGIADAMKEVNGMTTNVNFTPGGLAGGGGGSTNNFSMTVHTNAGTSTLTRDFAMLKAWAG